MSGVGGGSGGGSGGGGHDELAEVKVEIKELKKAIEEHGPGDGDCRIKLLAGLQEEKNLLRAEQQQREQQQQPQTGPAAKRRKLTSVKLEDQKPLTDAGSYVPVSQKKLAGFHADESTLYVRAEVRELWEALDKAVADARNLSVRGPPGTGKSTEVWAWAKHVAKEKGIKVTWFHFSEAKKVKVVIDGGGGTISDAGRAKIEEIESAAGGLLIVDGVTKKASADIHAACWAWQQERTEAYQKPSFVLVSSAAVNIALEQLMEVNLDTFTVGSWTLEQYQEACADDVFFESVKDKLHCPGVESEAADERSALILSKYELAGGCARWMFDFTHDDCVCDFDAHMEKVSDYQRLFDEVGGNELRDSVNHLRGATVTRGERGREKTSYFFISKRAVKELAEKCADKRVFFVKSYQKADETENPAYRGWVFEFDVDYQVQQAHQHHTKILLQIRNGEKEEWSVTRYVGGADTKDAMESLRGEEVLWVKATAWNQASYDFLRFWRHEGKLQMAAVNATCARSHDVRLDVVKKLATSLHDVGPVDAMRFEFLVPAGAGVMEVGQVVGRLCEWTNLGGVRWPNTPAVGEYLDGNFIITAAINATTN